MRTKSRRGGRSKPSRRSVDSSPLPVAPPSVPDRDVSNAEDSTPNDGFVSGQDVSNAEGNPLNVASRKETHDVLDKVDCFQVDTCIRCDESGDLLVCTEIGCPIALHEFCMSCQPSFDDEGRFYCPYCSYKRALVRVNELRKKAMLAKRALSEFIDTSVVTGGNSPQMGEAGKKTASDVSTRAVDVDLPNHGSHLGNESSQDRDMQVELNQSNEGENLARTAGDTSGTHQVDSLEDKKDGKTMEEENLRSTDDIEDEEIVKDQGQPETPSAPHEATMEEENLRLTDDIEDEEIVKDQGQPGTTSAHCDEEEAAVDDVDHGAGRESEDTGDGREQIRPDKEGMLENIDPASGNNDLKNEPFVKKKRFKTKANRKVDLQNLNSPRKSLRTPDPGEKSPHIQNPEPRKVSPHKQPPKPGKNHAAKIEKVSASRNSKQPASRNQFRNFDFHGGKRKRRFWSTEEEKMLKEGVQKFSSTVNKNLPWKKILEFGRHIFDDSRTPADLKDKWRNHLAK